MINKARKLFVIPMIAVLGLFSLTFTVSAQQPGAQAGAGDSVLCNIFPFINSIRLFNLGPNLCGGNVGETGEQAATTAAGLIQLVLQLVFVGIIVVAVYIIIKAAVKYIRSEGEEEKVKEAQKAIKTVFIGIAALFIGILGIVLVLAFFNVANPTGGANVDNPTGGNIGFIDQFFCSLFGNCQTN